ncbi:hypothetical protein BC332_19188 [Capsicum chinense]|nr:hypothetical protein BC332_19188 [Capsicum chinense]
MEERISKGLCYNCDEKYNFNYVCKNKRQLFSMKVEEPLESGEEENEGVMNNVKLYVMMAQGFPTYEEGYIMSCVSIHALNSVYDFKTMRVTSSVKGKLCYDYAISYKADKENIVVDALSRSENHVQLCCISGVYDHILDAVKFTWEKDPNLYKLLQDLKNGANLKPYYRFHSGFLSRSGKMIMGNNADLRQQVMQFYHDSAMGHSRINDILQRLVTTQK